MRVHRKQAMAVVVQHSLSVGTGFAKTIPPDHSERCPVEPPPQLGPVVQTKPYVQRKGIGPG
jgi:hypothetical protein